ncbi:MAG: phosphohydrolase [Butyrivibrio sp.]|nr:phosphohydrolase [Acetatifactor muris]MCM1558099.1 phosphohydrolase [Butyrivibrio sp.]MCM1560462.1 phosphohydrolase [Butyrivibrio sp.]
MKFVETDELKEGMRLARPIYNKKGVLLFERDSRLNSQSIDSVRKFGLLGVYILEPAEPLPPISEEDLEFERFQVATVFSILDELEQMVSTKKSSRLQTLAGTVIKKYGHLDGKVNFYQNLRSKEDYVCRHCLNTAILCAMITHVMNVRVDEQQLTVQSAIVHDIGKLRTPQEILFAREDTEAGRLKIYQDQLAGMDILEEAVSGGKSIRRVCTQAVKIGTDAENGNQALDSKTPIAAKILIVANRYDELTAMDLQGKSQSEVKAIQEFRQHPELYDAAVVEALTASVNILSAGVSVELNTGDRALVLSENPKDILRPTVLTFGDNCIVDLSLTGYRDLYVVDIMKTMDNRYIMRKEMVDNVRF